MAITIPDLAITDPTYYEVRLRMIDVNGEPKEISFLIDGAATAADIQTALRGYEAVTNAAFTSAYLAARYELTAYRTVPVAALKQQVHAFAALTFTKPDPINAAKTWEKSLAVPAYINALKVPSSLPATLVTDNANLNAFIQFIEDNLVKEGADGDFYTGGWSYQNGMSGFGTAPSKTDAK